MEPYFFTQFYDLATEQLDELDPESDDYREIHLALTTHAGYARLCFTSKDKDPSIKTDTPLFILREAHTESSLENKDDVYLPLIRFLSENLHQLWDHLCDKLLTSWEDELGIDCMVVEAACEVVHVDAVRTRSIEILLKVLRGRPELPLLIRLLADWYPDEVSFAAVPNGVGRFTLGKSDLSYAN